MTDDRMALVELIEKRADTDLVREMLAFAAARLMDLEVETLTGAPAGLRSPERLTQRNGYRERAWDTRAGRIDLAIPKLRAQCAGARAAETASGGRGPAEDDLRPGHGRSRPRAVGRGRRCLAGALPHAR